MASTSNYEVKLGFWTNWSYGKIQGATITLTRQHGGFLIAFLAIFVGMVGKSFWRLGCFTMHRYLSSVKSQDGLYHQRQAILRNSDTAPDGILRLLASMFAWRSSRRARRPIRRLLPVILAALMISATFGVASIFSSSVTSKTHNHVLLKGGRCGFSYARNAQDNSKLFTLLLPYETERASKFLNYGMQCYTEETNTDGCKLYAKPRLPLISTRGIACPFGANICKLGEDNLVMDTGMLDSLEHLDINIALEYRFQLRLVTTCAPLKTQGYMRDFNDSKHGAVKHYMYGPSNDFNFTYQLPIDHLYIPKWNVNAENMPRPEYQLGSISDVAGLNGWSSWSPINALNLVDADVKVLFMSAPSIYYLGPVTDPWFSAQTLSSEQVLGNSGGRIVELSTWKQDEPLGVMACARQVQYCNPKLPEGERCEPLRGFQDTQRSETFKKIFPTSEAYDVFFWVDSILVTSIIDFTTIVRYIGASALRVRYSLSTGVSASLPDTQWQLEAEHLMKGTLASLQEAFVETANGIPEALEEFRYSPLANETMAQKICANQKIVSNSYSSFNVLGVGLILTVGTLIIILDVGLGPTVAWWQRHKYGKHQAQDTECGTTEKLSSPLYGALEWSQTSILQLQRLAHESAGYGEWSGCDKAVPVTEQDRLLACLDLCDMEHPRFSTRKLSSVSESEEQVLPSRPLSVKQMNSGLETLASEIEVDNMGNSAVASDKQSEQRVSSLATRVEAVEADNTGNSAVKVHERTSNEQDEQKEPSLLIGERPAQPQE